jgi:uncharacterized protein with PQ loop repeat
MMDVLDYAPVAATAFAVPQFLPQILRLWATHDTDGVSWSGATLTSLNNAAWIAYFAFERYWTALVPSSSATLLAGMLAIMLTCRGQAKRRSSALISAWAVMLITAYIVAGRIGRRASSAVCVDRLPDSAPHRHLIRNLDAHPRRTRLLADLRPA